MISNDPDTNVRLVLLRYVNHRISEHLKSAFPKAHWEWTMSDPALFVVYGGTGRIRVYGVPDYDYADVTLNQQAALSLFYHRMADHAAKRHSFPSDRRMS